MDHAETAGQTASAAAEWQCILHLKNGNLDPVLNKAVREVVLVSGTFIFYLSTERPKK